MARMYYHKLIRDAIKGKIEAKGESCDVRAIEDDEEFVQELMKKITEEAAELSRCASREEFLKEYADLMIVLDTLTKELEIAPAEIEVALRENLEKKGGFAKRHFLNWADDAGYQLRKRHEG